MEMIDVVIWVGLFVSTLCLCAGCYFGGKRDGISEVLITILEKSEVKVVDKEDKVEKKAKK